MATLTASSHVGDGARPMGLDDFLEFIRDLIQGLTPRNALKATSNSLKGESQSLGVILKVSDVCPLSAEITF
jgi:hypothetical protein